MKSLVVALFLLFPIATWSQVVRFTSPITQTWPTIFTTDFEEVHRTISFDIDEVMIITETEIGKEFRKLQILSVENIEGDLIFYCTDMSNTKRITIALPEHQEYIDIYEPSIRTDEEIQLRIHID